VPQEQVDKLVVPGNDESMVDKVRQYVANTRGRKTEEDWFAPRVFKRAAQFLEVQERDRQFFLLIDCFDPHEPWDPPAEYVKAYDDGYDGPEPIVPNYSDASWISEQELERMRNLYSAEVTMTDCWLGNFLEKVDSLGFMENTLLMVISDHGVGLGEHGITGKLPNQLWPEITDIMFLARHPEGAGAGKTSDYYASTHDVAPTILGHLGIEPPEPMDGEDLSVILGGGSPEERSHFSLGYHNYVWARDETYTFFSRNDGTEARLYNVREDPKMQNDIALENQAVLNKMFGEYILEDAGGPLPKYGA
jgi:arylsulfatase A-like enzyme